MITLALDASTYIGTVAVLDGSRIVAEGEAAMRGRDAERLMPAVEDTLKRSGISLSQIDRIVCGAGPGSFTSLRIAGSIAKGMALGASKPLYAVSSLALIVAANAPATDAEYLAALDAMRGDVFTLAVRVKGTAVTLSGDAALVPRAGIGEAVGPDIGAKWAPHARGVARLESALQGPVDIASWEPTYGRLAEAQVKLEAASK